MSKKLIYSSVILLALISCSGFNLNSGTGNETDDGYQGLRKIEFTGTDENIANPERGMYKAIDFNGSSAPLTAAFAKSIRLQKITLVYNGYYLSDFMEGDISAEYLSMIRKNMQVLRENGLKCILRFAYKKSDAMTSKPWDTTPEITLRHIAQLKPVFQEYADVIAVLQAGFVGVWGEWAFTDHFISNPQTEEDYRYRKQVTDALLDAMPKTRQVALRTPHFKMDMYKLALADTLTETSAHDGSLRSRLCAHNDCFGATANDMGTFLSDEDKAFWKAESRYYFMGGETCQVSRFCTCQNSSNDVRDFHWTYLNEGYNKEVLKVWKNGGCFDKIIRELGYRFVLETAYTDKEAETGKDFRVVLKVKNEGCAAAMNPRDAELVLLSETGGKTVFKLSDVDPRHWFENQVQTIDTSVKLPEKKGKYTLYLNLPDPEPTLRENPLFSIRLANEGLWNEELGYNKICNLDIL